MCYRPLIYGDEIVTGIYTMTGTLKEIRERYGVSKGYVWGIRCGKIRRHLTLGLKPGILLLETPPLSEGELDPHEVCMPEEEVMRRIEVAQQLRQQSYPQSFLTHPEIDELLPV